LGVRKKRGRKVEGRRKRGTVRKGVKRNEGKGVSAGGGGVLKGSGKGRD